MKHLGRKMIRFIALFVGLATLGYFSIATWAKPVAPTATSKDAQVSQGGVAFAQQKQKEATIVSGMTIEIDSEGKAVIVAPRSESGALEPLAIPISGAKLLVDTLVVMIAEAETVASKQSNKP
jgi:hypothetical protein